MAADFLTYLSNKVCVYVTQKRNRSIVKTMINKSLVPLLFSFLLVCVAPLSPLFGSITKLSTDLLTTISLVTYKNGLLYTLNACVLHDNIIDKDTKCFLTQPSPLSFYPKYKNKETLDTQSVVSSNGHPTEGLSQFVEY